IPTILDLDKRLPKADLWDCHNYYLLIMDLPGFMFLELLFYFILFVLLFKNSQTELPHCDGEFTFALGQRSGMTLVLWQ
ncbi:MAG: hypothetical protein Q8847_02710, partial [Sweet potato little leaf phytoplasma]|nr:hypothetical protein [Sweet potato little leaf phytoplasma]